MHQEFNAHGLSSKRCHVHGRINPCLGVIALMKDGLQDGARGIGDVRVLPVERDRVSREIPMPKAQCAATSGDDELLIERTITERFPSGYIACQCRKRPAVDLRGADYRWVAGA